MSAGMMTALRPRSSRSVSVGALVGFVLCASVLAGAALIASRSSSSSRGTTTSAAVRAQRAALVTWEAAIHPAVLAAGQVVALGPRQGVSEVANRSQPAAQLRTMAIGWHVRLTVLASQIATAPAPSFMRSAGVLLNQAMAGYVHAARSVLLAIPARGARRTSLLSTASADGRAADKAYDAAVADIAIWRTRLGLAPDWSAS